MNKNIDDRYADILRVEGIMSQGYGISPKIVMRDKRLTPEAKCIYGYFSSFAGNGNQAFPCRDIMLDDLGMSVNRYYRHLKLLIDCDYVRVERTKTANNIYGKNIYTLVAVPNQIKREEQLEMSEVKPKAPSRRRAERQKQRGSGTQRTAGREAEAGYAEAARTPKAASVKRSELKERLAIDTLVKEEENNPNKVKLIEEIFLAVEDLSNSEEVRISGNVKKKEAICDLLDRLRPEHIRLVADNVSAEKAKVKNRKAYLQACIANSIFDINRQRQNTASASPSAAASKKEEELRAAKIEAERKRKKIRQQYPDIQKMEEELEQIQREMSKAILSRNEISLEKLKKTKEEKEVQLAQQIAQYGVSMYSF